MSALRSIHRIQPYRMSELSCGPAGEELTDTVSYRWGYHRGHHHHCRRIAPVTRFTPNSAAKPADYGTPTKVAEVSSSPPVCTIAIVGSKVPPSSVQLRVMTNTCPAGDVAELRVSVNGVQKETLGTTAGASKTFAATSGTNSVIVVAKYANGAESVVFQNPAL